MKRSLPLLILLALASCGGNRDDSVPVVSVIGNPPRIVDPSQKAMGTSDAVLLGAVAEGLVRYDAAGQIEPGLAIRWDVSDDGLYYTFRLAPDARIDAAQAARWLRSAMRQANRNPLRAVLDAIEEVVAVTPEVIEIRLVAPRPDLLLLLAQPEMAVLHDGEGSGAFSIAQRGRSRVELARVAPLMTLDDDTEEEPPLILRGERAGRAVARFADGSVALVLGGTFADLPIARVAQLPADALRFDPAQGLFGFALVHDRDFLADRENRRVIAMAIDRDRILATFAVRGWTATTALIPSGTGEVAIPAQPAWASATMADRRAFARAIAGAWAASKGAPPRLHVAMPQGPGARLLFARLLADWTAVGIEAVAVAEDSDDADIRLIDAVAPAPIASWYLTRFSCAASPVCDEDADRLIERAHPVAPEDRALLLTEADRRLAEAALFVPIAVPLRWSLVARRLTGFKENPRAIHPLDHLIAEKR